MHNKDRQHSLAFARALRGVRKSRGLTQKDLAKQIGSSRASIARFEREGILGLEMALAYMLAVGVRVEMPAHSSPFTSKP